MIDPNLPLIDLHRHLDGSLRLETILDLARQHDLPLPAWDVEQLRPYIQVTEPQPGVMAFISKFKWMVGVLVDYDACRRIAYENVADLLSESIDYAELRFSPCFMAEPHQLDPGGVVEAVIDGVQTASRDTGMPVNLIGILSRTYGPQTAQLELNALLRYADHLVALDLAGDELNYPGELYTEHIHKARQHVLQITVHAGESDGPHSIWQAIRQLGATRIGHAVHALKDPSLINHMRQNHIGIECNLTSNVQTSVVADYSSHPIGKFLQHGLLATINTDDPGISNITLRYEYEIAAPAAGLSPSQINQAQRNALEIAFLTPEQKEQLLHRKSHPNQTQDKP